MSRREKRGRNGNKELEEVVEYKSTRSSDLLQFSRCGSETVKQTALYPEDKDKPG